MADKSKDTGTGGININGKTHTMDVGASPADAVSNNAASWSAGDISVDQTVKDISVPTKETFAKYLSKETLAKVGSSTHPNVYPVGNGDKTAVQNLSLKDANGNPASPGPQNNEAKFNAGFNQQISSNNPAGLRRGAATGTGLDGNKLLATAAVAAASGGSYIKAATELTEPINAYTTNTVAPNLFDFSSPLKVIIGDGALISATNIRPYQKTANLATDAGTSVNVFDDTKSTSIETVAELIVTKTAGNAYPVDSPVSANKLNVVELNSAAPLATSTNAKRFKDINIGSSTSTIVSSKGKLTDNSGNTLLANAAVAANAGGSYIKFAQNLTTPIATYTTNIATPNLFDFNSPLKVVISDGTIGSAPTGLRDIKIIPSTSSPATDGGESKNILGTDATDDYTLTAAESYLLAGKETTNNYFPIQVIAPTVVTLNSANGLANSSNTNIFGSINIGSSTVISKGKLVVTGKPNGNELLANAAGAAPAGGSYIKFATLVSPIAAYTTTAVAPNLFDFNSPLKVVISDGTIGSVPTNLRNIKIIPSTSSPATDGGESKNILGDDATAGNYTLTAAESYLLAGNETKDNYFPIQVEAPTVVTLRDASNKPISVTVAQNNETNTNFFTKVIVIKDEDGKDVQYINSAITSTYTKVFIASSTGADPFKIKRGRAAGGDLDGNKLLATIAPIDVTTKKSILTAGAATYTTNIVEPNLFDFTSTLVGLTDGAIGSAPTGLRNIKIIPSTSSPATDGGESKNILGIDTTITSDYTLTAAKSYLLAGKETTKNYFPIQVEAPTIVTLSSANGLANSSNTNIFGSINIGSSTVISKGKLVAIGKPNGNKLLATIAPIDTTTKLPKLTSAASTYTDAAVEPNLFDFTSTLVGLADGATNVRSYYKTTNFATDAGTSVNVFKSINAVSIDTAAKLIVTKTAGNAYPVDLPVKPDVTLNSANGLANSSNTNIFGSINIGSSPVISKGKLVNTSGNPAIKLPDGNKLLATIAPIDTTTKLPKLTSAASTYTDAAVEPNLFDFTSTLVGLADGATNVRSYYKTTNFATDAGTSVNVFKSGNAVSIETAAKSIATKTAGNVYPVDSPIVGTGATATLTTVTLNSAAPLATSTNAKKFNDISVGSSSDISKGKLSRTNLPDGNKLLANAKMIVAPATVATLVDPIAKYTTAVLEPNLHNYDTSPIGLSAGSIGESPTNPREDLKYIPADSSISIDGGKSTNILGPATSAAPDYTLTLIDRATQASIVTAGNFFKIDAPTLVSNALSTKKIVLSTPLSVTDAQNDPFASSFFTKEIQKINDVDHVVSKLESSYTDALTDSRAAKVADADKFIIKRGKTEQTGGVDGNALLSSIAPKVDDKVALTPGAQTYIATVLKPNLNDIYNPKTESGVVIPEYETPGAPSGIKDLNKTSTFAEDAGTSKAILSGERKLILADATEVASIKTKDNFYPVNSLVKSDVKLDSKGSVSAAQNAPINYNFFTKNVFAAFVGGEKNDLQSSYTSDVDKLLINRGKTKSNNIIATDGNEILKNAVYPTSDTGTGYIKNAGVQSPAVEPYISQILKKNRFTTYEDDTTLESNWFAHRTTSFVGPHELKLGESIPLLTPRNYTFNRLAHIGTVLQLKSTYELGSDDPKYNPDKSGNQIAMLLPGLGQFGAGVPQSIELLNVKKLIENLTDEGITESQLVDFGSHFEGTINSTFEKFSGFTSLGMTVLAAALVATVIVAISVISLFPFLSQAIGSGKSGTRSKSEMGVASDFLKDAQGKDVPYGGRPGIGTFLGGAPGASSDNIIGDILSSLLPLGPAGGGKSGQLLRFFGIQPTRIQFFAAVEYGMLNFFGIATDAPFENKIGGGIFTAIRALAHPTPGALVVVARALVRSVLIIGLAFADLGKKADLLVKVEQILNILGVIKHSRLMSALNIFSQLGDNKGTIETGPGEPPSTAYNVTILGLDAGRKISEIDAYPDLGVTSLGATGSESDDVPDKAKNGDEQGGVNKNFLQKAGDWRYSKSRLAHGGSMRLAWASSQVPSMLITPPSITSRPLLDRGRSFWAPDAQSRMASKWIPRISQKDRESIEESLDAEYVPFYFHDLRTNEIVGFHAFLTSLSEDYSANYESTDGFGRIDPIRIYKNTNRKIGLSFQIAALDESDFNSMWAKINKLTTLLYPQYTAGQSITTKFGDTSDTFIKPFTQQIGASPMIRLRVGNLFHSNYSRFNLSGIFGLENVTTTLHDPAAPAAAPTPAAVSSAPPPVGTPVATVTPAQLAAARDKLASAQQAYDLAAKKVADAGQLPEKTRGWDMLKLRPALANAKREYDAAQATATAADADKATADKATADKAAATAAAAAKNAAPASPPPPPPPAPDLVEKMKTLVTDFMDPTKNVVVKSFESAGGKGLAGFIDSMAFDWYSGVTWDTYPGRKAPKMCKITISFTPIHDISPGLDSNGYNRAPIYPLGT